MVMAPSEWTIWQLIDASFPAGGFAQSGGLEAACKYGAVWDSDSLDAFLKANLVQTARGVLPFVFAVYDQPDHFETVDRRQDAMLTSHVANRASRAQGRGLLSASIASFPEADFTHLDTPCRVDQSPGHLAPVFGGVLQALNQTRSQTAKAFLFITLRGTISAAVRLGLVGPLEGQRLTTRYGQEAEQLAETCRDLVPDDAAQTMPVAELFQAGHDRLYTRLFQS